MKTILAFLFSILLNSVFGQNVISILKNFDSSMFEFDTEFVTTKQYNDFDFINIQPVEGALEGNRKYKVSYKDSVIKKISIFEKSTDSSYKQKYDLFVDGNNNEPVRLGLLVFYTNTGKQFFWPNYLVFVPKENMVFMLLPHEADKNQYFFDEIVLSSDHILKSGEFSILVLNDKLTPFKRLFYYNRCLVMSTNVRVSDESIIESTFISIYFKGNRRKFEIDFRKSTINDLALISCSYITDTYFIGDISYSKASYNFKDCQEIYLDPLLFPLHK